VSVFKDTVCNENIWLATLLRTFNALKDPVCDGTIRLAALLRTFNALSLGLQS